VSMILAVGAALMIGLAGYLTTSRGRWDPVGMVVLIAAVSMAASAGAVGDYSSQDVIFVAGLGFLLGATPILLRRFGAASEVDSQERGDESA